VCVHVAHEIFVGGGDGGRGHGESLDCHEWNLKCLLFFL
jgi:hypothetical protein